MHSGLADYFLGLYGGGRPKPFRYTEQQRQRFGLKCKEAAEDRAVPEMPLVFPASGRPNLRKLGELSHQLARADRTTELFTHCLFSYDWLLAKLRAGPLLALLQDYETAARGLQPGPARAAALVCDSLRLAGAALASQPAMLGPQLTGRLLPELPASPLLAGLVQQCDNRAPHHNALVPAFHCLHTPGGSLRFSLEGHHFAVFGFRLTTDHKHVVSISNRFITFDLSTGSQSSHVYPGVEGLMLGLDLSPDNKLVVAYNSSGQILLLDMLTSQVPAAAKLEIIDKISPTEWNYSHRN